MCSWLIQAWSRQENCCSRTCLIAVTFFIRTASTFSTSPITASKRTYHASHEFAFCLNHGLPFSNARLASLLTHRSKSGVFPLRSDRSYYNSNNKVHDFVRMALSNGQSSSPSALSSSAAREAGSLRILHVLLLRHGQTNWNAESRIQGSSGCTSALVKKLATLTLAMIYRLFQAHGQRH